MHRFEKLALVVALSLVTSEARAQQQQDSTRAVVPLSPIVVTATRVAVPAVTVAATVIRGEHLRARGITHVLDALQEIPGAAVVRTGSFGGQTSLYLRGGESGYVRVLVDGVPVNDPGGEFDFATLTTDAIERIEVVRGPASVLYGTDAATGVVQLFTRRGDAAPRLTARARAGTYGTLDTHVGVVGATGGARYGFDAGRFHSRGIYDFNNAYTNTVLSGSVALSPDSGTEARLTVQYGEHDTHIPTEGTGNVVDRNAHDSGRRVTAGLELGRQLSRRTAIRLLLASNDVDGGYDDNPDSPTDTLGFFGFQSLDHVQRRSADLRLDATLANGTVASVGAHVERQRQRSFNASQSEFGGSSSQFDVDRDNRAAYVQLLATRAQFALQLGARLDDNDAFGRFATLRGGVAWQLHTSMHARASVGTAFREPTFFQNYATGFVRGNPDLNPERTHSWELGIESRLHAGRVVLAATWFDQRFRDLIEYTGSAEAGAPNYFNVAVAKADGLELEIRAALDDALAVSSNYTLLRTRVAEPGFDVTTTGFFSPGASLLRRPRQVANLLLEWRPAERLRFDAGARWTSERDDIDYGNFTRVTLPSYAVADAGLEVALTRTTATAPVLTLRVSNLTDTSYEAVRGFRSPGRALLAGLRIGG